MGNERVQPGPRRVEAASRSEGLARVFLFCGLLSSCACSAHATLFLGYAERGRGRGRSRGHNQRTDSAQLPLPKGLSVGTALQTAANAPLWLGSERGTGRLGTGRLGTFDRSSAAFFLSTPHPHIEVTQQPAMPPSSTKHDPKQGTVATSSITAALAPMMAIASPYSSRAAHINPFGIHALKIEDGEAGERKKSKRRSLRQAAGRSLSPFTFHRRRRSPSGSRPASTASTEDSEDTDDSDVASIASSSVPSITPRNNAFDVGEDTDDEVPARDQPASARSSLEIPPDETSSDEENTYEEEEDDDDSVDSVVLDNTLYNAGCLDLHETWAKGKDKSGKSKEVVFDEYHDKDLQHDDEHITAPNVVLVEDQVGPHIQRRDSKMMSLHTSRPLFERNRCTLTIIHGEYDEAAKRSKRPKRYVVASDGSEESSWAIEWTIGTVLRDGDETLIVSVMETDTKLDALDPSTENPHSRMEHQRTRQAMASVLARQAIHLLERTRLAVKISCQAIHAKNSRHMLLDLIDFYAPTMVIVGSRGLGSLRGILLGSTSHYLVQKSSAPVMVARKRLKLPALPRGRADVVQSVRARHMRLDQAAVEKKSNAAEEAPAGDDEEEEKKKEHSETSDGEDSGDEGEDDRNKAKDKEDHQKHDVGSPLQQDVDRMDDRGMPDLKESEMEALSLHEKEATAKREKERIKQEKKAAKKSKTEAASQSHPDAAVDPASDDKKERERERGRALDEEEEARGRSKSR